VARFLQSLVIAGVAAAALGSLAPGASADGRVQVFPGMEIRQGSTVCTLGFVDPATRTGYSAGHCRGSGSVTDRDGRFLGVVGTSRDNTPNGTVVRTDEVISDYETITLADDVIISTALPGGRQLVVDPAAPLAAGQPICHLGAVSGESCGTVERVNNGWFTMSNGVVSQKGDSGGPVYTLLGNGTAALVGLFNSTWGQLPAAVSWQATGQQLREDGAATAAVVTAAGTTPQN
jgi:hypothetical protein